MIDSSCMELNFDSAGSFLCWDRHESEYSDRMRLPLRNFAALLQVPSIQQSAALALGRLANYSDDLAEAVVGNEILPQLVYSLSEQNRWNGTGL